MAGNMGWLRRRGKGKSRWRRYGSIQVSAAVSRARQCRRRRKAAPPRWQARWQVRWHV